MRCHIVLGIIALAYCLPLISRGEEKEFTHLFNGRDWTGWEYFLVKDDAQMKDVWSVKDGVLICQGKPMGYLATKEKYKNFKLVVAWRWAPGKNPGNSGVLLRITGEPMLLPKCVEAQLKSGSAGDIWAFQGFQVKSDTDRFRRVSNASIGEFMGVEKKTGNEKPVGEWNTSEITLDGDELTIAVNGKVVNQCHGCDVVAGQIGLQSEGGEVHFKTVKLLPLDE